MTAHVLSLGSASYDPRDMVLRGADGAKVELTNKARDVLACLADAAGEAVAVETIYGTVWPEVPAEPAALERAVGELRAALGDAEGTILTEVAPHGYQLAGIWVEAPNEPAPRGPRRARLIVGIVILLVAFIWLAGRA